MTLEINAGEISFTDVDGTIRLSSNGKMFHVLSRVSGIVSMPAYTINSAKGRVNRTDDYEIGPVNSLCTHAIGAVNFSITGTDNSASSYDRWVSFLGGSAVWLQHGRVSFSSNVQTNRACYQMVTFSPITYDSKLYLRRRIIHDSVGRLVSLTVNAITANCKFEAGAFS